MIRHFEEALLALFAAGKLNGTTHTCIGQEAIPVAVMPLLSDDDFVFSNHRGHGHFLARFGDYAGLLAEIMGREGGVCGGVGGSQHLRRGRYFSTGVQGESLPVAVGAAWQLKRESRGGVAVPFIGDGTWGQGAVYEALNMAALWRLPLVVMVENNDIAQTTPRTLTMAGSIENRARAFGVDYVRCAGHDVEALRAKVAPVIEAARGEGRPAVIEFQTQRLASHSKGDDTRDAAEVAAMRAGDWQDEWRAAGPREFAAVEEKVKARIAELVSEVEGRAPSCWKLDAHSVADAPAAGLTPNAKRQTPKSMASACSISSTALCTRRWRRMSAWFFSAKTCSIRMAARSRWRAGFRRNFPTACSRRRSANSDSRAWRTGSRSRGSAPSRSSCSAISFSSRWTRS